MRFMKKIVCILLAVMVALIVAAGERPKVAVVLSGGGAKGMAHIGALKVIEQAGIPVDIVAGTSMGSLVGGLYAIGYDAATLDSLVRVLDWTYLLTDRDDMSRQSLSDRKKRNTYFLSRGLTSGKAAESVLGVIKGRNVELLLRRLCMGYTDSMDFSRLPIPFACVATDIADYTEVDFHSGRLPQAMRASMAIPAVFTAVRHGNKVLVDGGLRNNYPADVARQMGADIIIGIDVTTPLRTVDKLNSTIDVVQQLLDVSTKNKYDENVAMTDLHIHVDPKSYSAASFSRAAIDTLLRWGEEETMKHWDDLMAVKKRLGLSANWKPKRAGRVNPSVLTEKSRLVGVTFENMTPQDEQFLRQKFHLNHLDSIDKRDEEQMITSMRVDLFFQSATSQLVKEADGYRLILTAGNRKSTQVNVGLRFDTEEMVAMQVNASLPLNKTLLFSSDITLRLGKRIMAGGEITIHPPSFRVSRPVLSYYFYRNDIDVNFEGDREYNVLFNHHQASLEPLNFRFHNFDIRMGVRWDYYHFSNMLQSEQSRDVTFENDHYISYRAQANYNSENDWYFPSRGARFEAGYAYITDNFAKMKGSAGLSDVSANWRKSFTFGSRFTVQPMLYGRLLFGSELPHIFGNIMGGDTFGRYVEQQLPFSGIGNVEYAERHMVAVRLQAQQRMGSSHYVLVRATVAQHADELRELFQTKTLLGGQLAYYYKTMFGPLGLTAGYANRTKVPYFYINLGYVF